MARLNFAFIRTAFLAVGVVLVGLLVVLQVVSLEKASSFKSTSSEAPSSLPQFECRPLAFRHNDPVLPLTDYWATSLRLEPVRWST
jgi:hypothetical protein